MAKVTVHVLDTVSGQPAADVRVTLRRDGEAGLVADVWTNGEGRLNRPLIEGQQVRAGGYDLTFYVGDYWRRRGDDLASPPFVDVIPVRILLADDQNYHVPLLVSRYGYSVYRGS